MMKLSKVYGVRGNQVFLTFTAVICTAILVWVWERTPLVATLLPSQQNFNFRPVGGTPKGDLLKDEKSYRYDENDLSNATTDLRNEKAQQVVNLDLSNATTMLPKNEKEEQALVVEPSNSTIVLPRNEQVLYAPGVASVGSLEQSSTEKKKEIEKGILEPADEKECNYAKGRWVPDDRRPLYSGFQCKQWLSEMWACRIMQRIDFSYEGFRWQPEECQMPEFESSNFLQRMKNKTIALVGDSLGRQQFQSLMCMATAGVFSPDVQDVGREYGLIKARGAIRPDGWVYRFPNTNTTILYYWSASLCELEPLNVSNPMTSYAMHLDRPAQFLRNYLHKFDVLVLNTGHHWNRGKLIANRWEMFAAGSPVKDGKLSIISNARNFAVHSVIKWLDSELPRHPRLKAFFRTLSPRHFANGDWNTGGSCDNTTPLAGGNQVSANVSYDAPAETATKGTRVKLLDITALSQLRDEGHISKYSVKASTGVHDCLHWCLPGVPDAWNEILFAQI